jgi:diguanylate cyclase (GGDEF)-like protein
MLPNLLQGGTCAVWGKRASQWHGGANYNAASQAQDITSDRTRYTQAANHLLRRKSKSKAKEWTKLEHRVLIPKRWVRCALVWLCLVVPFALSLAAMAQVDTTEWRSGLVSLNNGWLAQEGDDPSWAKSDLDDRGWHKLELDDLGASKPGWRWYRLHVKLTPGHEEVHLLIAGGEGTYEIFLNGERADGAEIRPMFGVYRPTEQIFVPHNEGDDLTIALRTHAPPIYTVWALPLFLTADLGTASAIEDDRAAMQAQRLYSAIPSIAINLALVLAGIGALALFSSKRGDGEYVWLGLYLLALGTSNGILYSSTSGVLPLAFSGLIADSLIYIYVILQIELTFSFAKQRINKPWRVYELLLLLMPIANPAPHQNWLSNNIYTSAEAIAILPAAFLLPILLLGWYRGGNREAGWLIMPSLLPAAATAAFDLGSYSIWSGWGKADFLADPIQAGQAQLQLTDVADFVFLLAIGIVMFFRFMRVSKEQVRSEERIRFLAYFDALTGLPNRTFLKDQVRQAVAAARRRGEKIALLYLGLDRFKTINDSLGHTIGDLLLKDTAERFKGCIGLEDMVARVGGDEFVALLSNVKDVADATISADRIVKSISGKFEIEGHSLNTSCSLGISIFPDHSDDCETLIKFADQAMYCAKENGGNGLRFFTEDLNAQAVARLTLENDLRLAIERAEFFLVYQPQMEIASGQISGLEVLIRWQHPRLGLVPPDKFIALAEKTGLILPIGEWVMRTACAQVRKWHDDGLLVTPVAVNVSAVQFCQNGFCELVDSILRETGLDPQYLELELTESLLLSNVDVMLSVLQVLRDMGLKLAIDDFGTGYSSLSYLRQFRANKVKIDRAFIRNLATDFDDGTITTAIIRMTKSLNLRVLAEGVENEAQLAFLREYECDEIQGYYFSKPISGAELEDKMLALSI